MKKRGFLLILLVTLIMHSWATEKKEYWKQDKVILAGKVKNIRKHKRHKTILFKFTDLLGVSGQYTANVDYRGEFKIEVPIRYPQDFYLEYGSQATLFCSPGDNLFIEVDAAISNKKNGKSKGQYFVNVTGGSAVKINRDIYKFLDNLPDDKYSPKNARDATKLKSPEEYTIYIEQREKEYQNYLDRFNNENKTDKLFQKWGKDRLQYESWNDLMRYRWYNPLLNGMTGSFYLPESYFSFLQDYDMDDNSLISMYHARFLHELSMYSKFKPKDLPKKARKFFKSKNNGEEAKAIKMIEINTTGFTRDLCISKFYLNILKRQQVKEFETVYDNAKIHNKYFKGVVKEEYEKLKKSLANQNTDGTSLISISNDVTKSIMKTITSRYKGKVIYMDFWAPWCSPCMREMPYSKKLQEYFKGEDVVFLYLANNCKQNSWKTTIANKKLTGEHLFLSNAQFNVLSSELGINAIPHYTLVNKKGNIVYKNAIRPSDEHKVKSLIKKLL